MMVTVFWRHLTTLQWQRLPSQSAEEVLCRNSRQHRCSQ